MQHEKYINEGVYHMSDDEVKEVAINGTIGIHYAFNNYKEDVAHVLKLREVVLKDYPNMSDADMTVWKIARHESIRHAGFTTLFVMIPVEDYLRLRKEGAIFIR